MDNRHISDEYTQIAQELIDTIPGLEYIRNSSVSIIYLASDHEKKSSGKLIYGQCERVPDKYRWGIPYDFTITVFEPNVERFTDDQLRILLHHELLHIGIEKDGNEETYKIVPHDLEDFREIIDTYGMDWHEQT